MTVSDFKIYTDKEIIECKKCKKKPLKMLRDIKGHWKAENVYRHLKNCHSEPTETSLSVDADDPTTVGAETALSVDGDDPTAVVALTNPLEIEETSSDIATGSVMSPRSSSDDDDTEDEPPAKVAKNS